MKPLSTDLRERIANALDGKTSQDSIAQRFAVSLSSVERLAKKKRQGIPLKPGFSTGRKPKIAPGQWPRLEEIVRSRTDWTAQSLVHAWEEETGVKVSVPTMTRVLGKIAFVFKKNPESRWKEMRQSARNSGSR